jgi:hypothetical protein
MIEPFITVRRHPYEEPYHIQLEFLASNGFFSGTTEIYCNVEDITTLGKALKNFPKKVGDEYSYEYGSEDPTKKFYRYFLLRTYTFDSAGHCALQIKINFNTREPEEGLCTFSIQAESAAINRLGELFEQFAKLEHLEMRWNLKEGHLYKQNQPEADRF